VTCNAPVMPTPRYASDLMTRDVVTLEERTRLDNLEQALRTLRFRHMPVTDGSKLIGLISERDLLQVSASSVLPNKRAQDRFVAKLVCVGDIMTRDVVTVPPDAALADVAKLMLERKLGCVPVVNGDGTLLGIITEADFVRLVRTWLPQP
jgi:CBS domain-containing membrane protein